MSNTGGAWDNGKKLIEDEERDLAANTGKGSERHKAAVAGATTTYRLDPLGQRIRKTGTEDTLYHYDQEGRLISETAPDGTPRKDYVWLGDQPLAIIQ